MSISMSSGGGGPASLLYSAGIGGGGGNGALFLSTGMGGGGGKGRLRRVLSASGAAAKRTAHLADCATEMHS